MVGKIGNLNPTAVMSFSLDLQTISKLQERATKNRSSLSAEARYLIRMGLIYVEQVLPGQTPLVQQTVNGVENVEQ